MPKLHKEISMADIQTCEATGLLSRVLPEPATRLLSRAGPVLEMPTSAMDKPDDSLASIAESHNNPGDTSCVDSSTWAETPVAGPQEHKEISMADIQTCKATGSLSRVFPELTTKLLSRAGPVLEMPTSAMDKPDDSLASLAESNNNPADTSCVDSSSWAETPVAGPQEGLSMVKLQ
jgi:hypothetical protein